MRNRPRSPYSKRDAVMGSRTLSTENIRRLSQHSNSSDHNSTDNAKPAPSSFVVEDQEDIENPHIFMRDMQPREQRFQTAPNEARTTKDILHENRITPNNRYCITINNQHSHNNYNQNEKQFNESMNNSRDKGIKRMRNENGDMNCVVQYKSLTSKIGRVGLS